MTLPALFILPVLAVAGFLAAAVYAHEGHVEPAISTGVGGLVALGIWSEVALRLRAKIEVLKERLAEERGR